MTNVSSVLLDQMSIYTVINVNLKGHEDVR